MKMTVRLATLTVSVAIAMYGDVIYLGPVADVGGGFGSIQNLLTISTNNSTASGCSGPGAIGPGVCPDGFVGGDESPPAGSPKNETFVIADVGSASDIGFFYNASQPGGGTVTLNAMAFSVFDSNGTIIGTVGGNIVCDPNATAGTCAGGAVTLDFTEPGVGNAGFLFSLTGQQANQLEVLAGTNTIGFAANISGEAGGLETFTLVDLNRDGEDPVIPEPATYALMGTGLLGVLYWNRRRRV